MAGEYDEREVSSADVSPSRLTDLAVCDECQMTATATPSGDSETYYSYFVCDPPLACQIRSEEISGITAHLNFVRLMIEYHLQLKSKPLSLYCMLFR